MIFIPTENTNLEWAEKYTRSSYKPKTKEEISNNWTYLFYLRVFEEKGYIIVHQTFGEDIELSPKDSAKFLKCLTCDKALGK